MSFPRDAYPYTNFHELNLGYFITHFREIFSQWADLYDQMLSWKDATDADIATWKAGVEADLDQREADLRAELETWKTQTGQDIAGWEDAMLAALTAWQTATQAVFEAIRVEAAGSATAAAASATDAATAKTAAETAQAAAEAAAASIAASAAQIATNTGDISDLKTQINVVVEETPGVNIFPGYVEPGGIVTADGTDNDSDSALTNYERSDYFPVDPANSNIYVLRETGLWGMRLFWYDEDKTFISQTQIFTGSVTALSNSAEIPKNAKFIRTYRDNTADSWVVLSYTVQSEYTPYNLEYVIKENIIGESNLTSELQIKVNKSENLPDIENDLLTTKSINFFNGKFPNSGYFDANGVNANSNNFKRTDFIPIDTENSNIYFVRNTTPYLLTIRFYSANDETTAVGSANIQIFGGSVTDLLRTVTIPENGNYLRMYTNASTDGSTLMLSYTEDSVFYPYGERYYLKDKTVAENNLTDALKDKINGIYPLYGKTIAFMGDSIIGNFYDSTGVCAVLAEKTGANVINCAFGGTRMGYRYGNNIQYTYWNALSGAKLADAIASGTWADQETAVENLTGGLAYFGDRLDALESVDWSTVDFIMWEYGTNDFMTDVALSDSENPTNMYAFDNAYRHAIETILTAYPNIRIITATPMYRWYENEGVYTEDSNTYINADYMGVNHKLTDFVAKAQEISREYQIPCIDDYYTLGANSFTRLAFFNASDGTHPNASGRKRLAEHLAGQLTALV